MASQYVRSRPPSDKMARVEALLGRYPNLSEIELATLINLFPTLRILEVGLMTANDRVSGKFEAFHRDHGKKLKMPMSSLIAFVAVPATVAIGLLWWSMGRFMGV
jgi:hypothetical protein